MIKIYITNMTSTTTIINNYEFDYVTNFCTNCGASLKTSYKFCPKCGMKLPIFLYSQIPNASSVPYIYTGTVPAATYDTIIEI